MLHYDTKDVAKDVASFLRSEEIASHWIWIPVPCDSQVSTISEWRPLPQYGLVPVEFVLPNLDPTQGECLAANVFQKVDQKPTEFARNVSSSMEKNIFYISAEFCGCDPLHEV
jgi:hypothetical protein